MPTPETQPPNQELIERLHALLEAAEAADIPRELSPLAEGPELWPWIAAAVVLAALAAFVIARVLRKKGTPEAPTIPPYHELLAALREAETNATDAPFTGERIVPAIRRYLGRLIPGTRNATPGELRLLPPPPSAPETLLSETADLLEALDRGRFAPPGGDGAAGLDSDLLARLWRHADTLKALEEARASSVPGGRAPVAKEVPR